jgi:hypothetical protein
MGFGHRERRELAPRFEHSLQERLPEWKAVSPHTGPGEQANAVPAPHKLLGDRGD